MLFGLSAFFQPVDQVSSMQQQRTPSHFTLTDKITAFYVCSMPFWLINIKVGCWPPYLQNSDLTFSAGEEPERSRENNK